MDRYLDGISSLCVNLPVHMVLVSGADQKPSAQGTSKSTLFLAEGCLVKRGIIIMVDYKLFAEIWLQ